MSLAKLREECPHFRRGRKRSSQGRVVGGKRFARPLREQGMDCAEENVWRRLSGQRFVGKREETGIVGDDVPEEAVEGGQVGNRLDIAPATEERDKAILIHVTDCIQLS